MEGGPMRKNKKEQHSDAAKQHKPHACRPELHTEVLALKQDLQTAKKTNQKLASINTDLKKQVKEFTRMEISWVVEKGNLVHKNRTLQRILGRKYCDAKNEINRLEGVLKAAETNMAFMKKENKTPQAASEKTLDEGERWRTQEEQIAKELKEMHKTCQEQVVVIMKKEKLIGRFKREMLAIAKECLQREDANTKQETASRDSLEKKRRTKERSLPQKRRKI